MAFRPQAPILKVRTDDYSVQRQRDPLVNQVNSLSEQPLVNSSFIENKEFQFRVANPKTEVRIRHTLGREYRGWIIANRDQAVEFVEVQGNSRKKDFLLLNLTPVPVADLDFTISVLVF